MREKKVFRNVYIGFVLLFFYAPMLCVAVYSFNSASSGAVWTGFTGEWYTRMLGNQALMRSLANSLQIGFAASLISAVLGTMGAVAAGKLSARLKGAFSSLLYIPLIVPEIVMAVALLAVFSYVPFMYGITSILLAHTTFCIPYVFLMVSVRLNNLDPALMEAARDLGANKAKAFFTVTLPLIRPAIVSGTLLAFAMSLDDVIISSFLAGPTSMTLPVQIFSMLKLGVTPDINALCTVMLLITFLAAGFIQFSGSRKNKDMEDEE